MPDKGSKATGGSQTGLRTVVISGLLALLASLVGASAGPVATNLLENKPAVPGAPTNTLPATVFQGKVELNAKVEVANRTIDPVRLYTPLNAQDALSVRHGDTLNFSLSCSISPTDGSGKLSIFMLAVPNGLKMVGEPHLVTANGIEAQVALSVEGIAWAWVGPEVVVSGSAHGSFTATVETDQPAYLTVTWGCPAYISDQQIMPGVSRAILKVERS